MKSLIPYLMALGCLFGATPAVADADTIMDRIASLSSPEMAGRGSGSPQGLAAAETLATWFAEAGLAPAFAGEWLQEFNLTGEGFAGQDLAGATSVNVAGLAPGSGALAGRFVVVGAHHDHLGRVDGRSIPADPAEPDTYYPGANDNASGVAVLVELARTATRGGDRRGVLFVGFGAEEVGLQGSSHFVEDLPVPRDSIDAMINLDTVGQLNDGHLYVSGVGTSPAFGAIVAAAERDDLALASSRGGWSGSDHMVFNTREIPVLFLFGGSYRQYNRPTDTALNCRAADVERVADFAIRLVDGVRRAPGPIPWVMVGAKDLREVEDGEQDRRTWLGTMPDFTVGPKGYKLANVFDASPAARAGLQKGDIITRLGSRPVEDLATFTRALRAHAPGDLVEIVARRGDVTLRFTVVLADRSERR